jgi:UDP-N-acetylmuramate dehydrogenase
VELVNQMQLQKNYSLKSYNTFGIEAKCALFCEVKNTDTIAEVIESTDFKQTPKLVLGAGFKKFTQRNKS